MLLTIIIPAYNAEATIGRTLHSLEIIQPAMREKVEAIIVDDGSTDKTTDIVSAFLKRDILPNAIMINKTNGGTASARNAAFKKATGEWVFLLDADDSLVFDFTNFLLKNEDASIVGFSIAFVKNNKITGKLKPQHIDSDHHLDIVTANCPHFTCNVVFRLDCVDSLFDQRFPQLEDWYFWLTNPRLFEHMVEYPDVYIAHVHIHSGNKSANFFKRGIDRQLIAEDLLGLPELTTKQINHLRIQQGIGLLQQGKAMPLKLLFSWPCDSLLYVKAWLYYILRRHVGTLLGRYR